MTITIKTKAFNLNELESLSCYKYCKAIENNDSIQIEIDDQLLREFVDCLTLCYNKFNLLYHKDTAMPTDNPLLQVRMESLFRKKSMIKNILDAIIRNPHFDIEILN